VEDSEPVTDPAQCRQPLPVTDTIAEEPPAPMTPQEDVPAQLLSVLGGYEPSHPEDEVEDPTVEAARTSEDERTEGSPITC